MRCRSSVGLYGRVYTSPDRYSVVRHKQACGLRIALDRALGPLMPADVERPVGREEVERRVRQVLVHQSRKDPPIAGCSRPSSCAASRCRSRSPRTSGGPSGWRSAPSESCSGSSSSSHSRAWLPMRWRSELMDNVFRSQYRDMEPADRCFAVHADLNRFLPLRGNFQDGA